MFGLVAGMVLAVSRFRLLSDARWASITDLLPAGTGNRGLPFPMPGRWSRGIAWRDVPAVFGPWQTIWTWHRRMTGDGTRDTVLHRLLTHADVPAPDAASAPPPL
ncbi:transposase [Amycolatopsis thermoflava]|uniref:transposase n=1 Tax=Amycolatopsis thermoflava TaxID=84480 RepID=UPI003667F49A